MLSGNVPDVSPIRDIHAEKRQQANNKVAEEKREMARERCDHEQVRPWSNVRSCEFDERAKRCRNHVARMNRHDPVICNHIRYTEIPARPAGTRLQIGGCQT